MEKQKTNYERQLELAAELLPHISALSDACQAAINGAFGPDTQKYDDLMEVILNVERGISEKFSSDSRASVQAINRTQRHGETLERATVHEYDLTGIRPSVTEKEDHIANANNANTPNPQMIQVISERDALSTSIRDVSAAAGLCNESDTPSIRELTHLAESLGKRRTVLPGAALEAIRQMDMLGKSIFDAAVKAGACKPDAQLSGPQLALLADGLGTAAAENASRNDAAARLNPDSTGTETWYARAKLEMERKSITQESLTSILGVATRGAVGHYLSGRRDPSPQQLVDLSGALDVNVGWLMTGGHKAPPIANLFSNNVVTAASRSIGELTGNKNIGVTGRVINAIKDAMEQDAVASAQNTPHKPIDTSDEEAFTVLLGYLDEKDWINDETDDSDSGPGMS
ncbi:helix-turn-helix domain-containing protein [Marinobacter sp. ELB17]|uniref:helix-turn-helix domain-containing protein n=1 Tax=Marinobacter sp. ELB17 TaxID=270374 RepID=UPI0000F388C0|nr:helix-turn-helix transcriptional regulator [Marinobacter sp. ELB17]EAZ97298.1 hypothetical protein MELB17_09568 [Marinobacter sp. ELB17]EAZ97334.1 hypothetical protein MELB17_09358 [Marinobacter sp. ELB17]